VIHAEQVMVHHVPGKTHVNGPWCRWHEHCLRAMIVNHLLVIMTDSRFIKIHASPMMMGHPPMMMDRSYMLRACRYGLTRSSQVASSTSLALDVPTIRSSEPPLSSATSSL
jgi:hypothetical protein